jgi:hypothetical protein
MHSTLLHTGRSRNPQIICSIRSCSATSGHLGGWSERDHPLGSLRTGWARRRLVQPFLDLIEVQADSGKVILPGDPIGSLGIADPPGARGELADPGSEALGGQEQQALVFRQASQATRTGGLIEGRDFI